MLRRPHLARLLALALLLQWGLMLGHCLTLTASAAAQALLLDGAICRADLGEPADAPQHPAGTAAAHLDCPFCQGAAAPPGPPPALPGAPMAYALRLPMLRAGLPPAPARAPPQQPRAPPIA